METTKYFTCKLLTNVVINASLATEGNMQTLDYIPGSNFLGIVAGELYNELSSLESFELFHSNKVSFGDALIAKDNYQSYQMPYSLYQAKLGNNIIGDTVWVHHIVNNLKEKPKDESGNYLQLKQHRGGCLNSNHDYIDKVSKSFSLKSAFNRKERRSKEGAMFGFDSIKKGQEFIFSVIFKDEKHVEKVTSVLEGHHRIGKSKTAQFGQVKIEPIDKPKVFSSKNSKGKLIIYAESNLCFFNEYGQSTFQPNAADFEKQIDGSEINWSDSQIRTYSYSPWNGHRNTTNTQRDTIEKGSVIVVDLKEDIDVENLPKQVGEYTAEGLGRVIYNPDFLSANLKDGILSFKLNGADDDYDQQQDSADNKAVKISSHLGRFLLHRKNKENNDLEIGKKIIEFINSGDGKTLKDKAITSSQWGAIRKKAIQASNVTELIEELFAEESGFLIHGVAAEKIWDKIRGKRRRILKEIIERNRELGTDYTAKLAAELAKLNRN